MKPATSTIPQKPRETASKGGFIGTALQMKQEADAVIKRGEVACLQAKGYRLLTFESYF